MKQNYWVLMADVINSNQKPANEVQQILAACLTEINFKFKSGIVSPLTITLGDEFQGVVANIKMATDIIIAIQESLITLKSPFSLRYSLCYGIIETEINPNIAHGMLGEALTNARKQLNDLKKEENNIWITTGNFAFDNAYKNSYNVYEALMRQLHREKDYELAIAFMENPDYKYVADKLNKTRAQVWKKAKTMQIKAYHDQKNVLKYLASTLK